MKWPNEGFVTGLNAAGWSSVTLSMQEILLNEFLSLIKSTIYIKWPVCRMNGDVTTETQCDIPHCVFHHHAEPEGCQPGGGTMTHNECTSMVMLCYARIIIAILMHWYFLHDPLRQITLWVWVKLDRLSAGKHLGFIIPDMMLMEIRKLFE